MHYMHWCTDKTGGKANFGVSAGTGAGVARVYCELFWAIHMVAAYGDRSSVTDGTGKA